MADRPNIVLVVDDDHTTLELAVELLVSAGYDASGASTVAAALGSVQASRPDLVVLDLNLGDEDGLEVVRRLRADPSTTDVRVVASSASTSHADLERASSAGCDSFLAKPLTARSFLDAVETTLGRRGHL